MKTNLPFNVLLIDDEKDFCDLVSRMFEKEELHIDCAFSLKEASDKLHQHPSLVLLDHHLPDGSGLLFLQTNRKDFDSSRVIFITADPSPFLRRQALEAGAERFLNKPFSYSKIHDILQQVINE